MLALTVLTGMIMVGCLLVCWLARQQFRKLQAEVSLLPPPIDDMGAEHPLVGVSVGHLLELPQELVGRPLVVVIAAPGCGSCRGQVERLLQERAKQMVPALCLVFRKDDPAKIQMFFDTYHKQLPVMMAPDELMNRLNITTFPFLFLLDERGTICRVERRMERLIARYRTLWQSPAKRSSGRRGARETMP